MAILAKNRNSDRQYPLCAMQPFALSEVSTGVEIPLIKVPTGARVIGGHITTDVAFNSTTSDVVILGDADDPNRYTGTPISVHAVGSTAIVPTGYKYANPAFITLTWTSGGGTPTTGQAVAMVQYIIDGRGNEVEPSLT